MSEEFTKRNKSFANIDVDHLKHMNPNAFDKDSSEATEDHVPYLAWGLLGKNTAAIAKNFLDNGQDVIINGYLEIEAWEEIEEHLEIDYRFLLLPSEIVNIERDSQRTAEIKMGEKAVQRGQEHFRNERFFQSFEVLETSDQSILETVQYIEESIK